LARVLGAARCRDRVQAGGVLKSLAGIVAFSAPGANSQAHFTRAGCFLGSRFDYRFDYRSAHQSVRTEPPMKTMALRRLTLVLSCCWCFNVTAGLLSDDEN